MDSFVVSARKYRPDTFDLVVGQQSITSTLKNAIRNNQLAQAFLFTGPRGVGKTTCARILAKTINCENISENIEACNVCESCESFTRSHSFNVHELDAASNNSVDGIRTLVDQVRIPPQLGKYKIYIIDEVHMLSQAAFNAFLKTLEEPPAYAKFILATTEKHKIIPTILSRCQIFDFARITVNDIISQLQYVAGKEGVEAEPEALHIIAQKADGAMRDALSIFDQLVSYSGNSITYKQTIENLNVLDYDYYFRVTDMVLEEDASGMLLLIDEILHKGFDGLDFIAGLGSHLRNLLVARHEATVTLIETSEDVRKKYLDQARRCDDSFLLDALDLSNRADVQYKTSSNKRLTLELCLLQTMARVKKKGLSEPAINQPVLPVMGKPQKQVVTSTPDPSHEEKKKITSQETAPAARPKTVNPIARLSLKIHQDPAGDDDGQVEEPVPEELPAEDIAVDRFLECWKNIAESFRLDSHGLYLAMTTYEPLLNKEGLIAVFLDNAIQEDIFNERKTEILGRLRRELNNYGMQIETRIRENGFKQKAYLPKEKYEKLLEINPLISKLKKELDLDFDY